MYGVAQGSVLGPPLFKIYIRSLYKYVEPTKFTIEGFADDHQLIKQFMICIQQKALGEDIVPPKKITPEISAESDDEEDSNEEEEKVSPGKPRAGQGRGKNIDNCSDESDEEQTEKPQPIKMTINKDVGKKGKKKKRKLADLNASDESGDGDSGSDFKLSDEKSDDSEWDEALSESDSDLGYGKRGRGGKKASREATRRSTRTKRNRFDEDFICDDSESEDYGGRSKRRSKWSESEPSDR